MQNLMDEILNKEKHVIVEYIGYYDLKKLKQAKLSYILNI